MSDDDIDSYSWGALVRTPGELLLAKGQEREAATKKSTKRFISAESLKLDSYRLAKNVLMSGFKPDYMIALWRGGAPVGCYIHEFLKKCGCKPDHICIRTSRYHGVDQASETVQIHNLGYLLERLKKDDKVLLVDDVHDTGLTVKAFVEKLQEKLGCPVELRVATVYFKPERNQTGVEPDYHVHKVPGSEWLVFPHELEGLSWEEMDPEVVEMIKKVGE